ncbi:uncharacterized protein LOC132637433 [Lycium barbarum]|uniref:uncharacterized protein LOC132637433 n=1 Tax=Lycium barbarum TaxID=112863 RepID=UPI00293F4549|nr:uncharacterized protein LOC132637433 [Lycium barbarum]
MDPLKYIFRQPMPIGKLAKWQMLLSEFDITYIAQKSIKGQALADLLAESQVDEDSEPLRIYFPDEAVLTKVRTGSTVLGGQCPAIAPVHAPQAAREGMILTVSKGSQTRVGAQSAEQKRWEKFYMIKSQTYDGHPNADAYEFLMIGAKLGWRAFLETRTVGSPLLTWEEFSRVFLEKKVPFSLREKRRDRFDHLEQGSMSVTENEMEFNALSRHALTILPDEAERICKFIRGLSYHLKVAAMFAVAIQPSPGGTSGYSGGYSPRQSSQSSYPRPGGRSGYSRSSPPPAARGGCYECGQASTLRPASQPWRGGSQSDRGSSYSGRDGTQTNRGGDRGDSQSGVVEPSVMHFRLKIRKEDIPKTAFHTRYHYEFLVMSFGLTNALATFMELMNDVFRLYLDFFVILFINDILIYSRIREEHERHLRIVLETSREKRLYAKFFKCDFRFSFVVFWGHMVSKDGIMVDPRRIEVVRDWNMPTTVSNTWSFFGLASYYP